MIVAQDVEADKGVGIEEMALELAMRIRLAAAEGIPLHEVERTVLTEVLKIGLAALRELVRLTGPGDLGETWTSPEGRALKRLPQPRRREVRTIFGTLEFERTVYGTREGQAIKFVPLDARLELSESKFSYLLQELSQLLACEDPFATVSEILERLLGQTICVDSLERINHQMAREAEAFRDAQPTPPAEEEGAILVQSADGKGVPIRRPADAPRIADHQRRRGPKKDRKKMAIVGTVYTVDRHVRAPEDIVAALFRRPDEPAPDHARPRPRHKQVYASLTHESPHEDQSRDGLATVMGWITQQAEARNPKGAKETVCVMDGQKSLWTSLRLFQEDQPLVEILDLLHVTQRLWDLAHLFERPQSPAAEEFVRRLLLRILRGEVQAVVAGLRRKATARRLTGRRRKLLASICGYFRENRDRMRYHDYLARGYPIASGAIEGACRHYVKDRMERAGMSWVKLGAQAMLDLRSIRLNGDWDAFNDYRIVSETRRLYPARDLLGRTPWSLAG